MMCNETCSKIVLLAFNFIFLILGLLIMGVGLYVKFVRTEIDDMIGSSLLPAAIYVCITAGGVVVLVSMLGCMGTLLQSKIMLSVYAGFLILVFVLEVVGGILGFVFHGQVDNILKEHVKTAISTKYGYSDFQLITTAVDTMQQELECCGYNTPTDWGNSKYYNDTTADIVTERGAAIMPVSCCKKMGQAGCNTAHDDNLRFPQGCRSEVKDILETNLIFLGAASITVGAIQLVGAILAISLCMKSGDDVDDF